VQTPFVTDKESDLPEEPSGQSNGRDRAVKSVGHALEIVDLLAREQRGIGVTQLATQLGMNASTVHHLLKTLEMWQLVEQHPASKLYRLGVRSVQWGQAYMAGLDLYSVAQPHLTAVSHDTGETVTLAGIERTNIVVLATIPGRHTVRSHGATTSRHNAHATALGKIFLAELPESELPEIVAETGLARFTPHTIGGLRQLETELVEVRRRGYAFDLEELEIGLSCIAAGVRNHAGEIVAAIGVSIPMTRFEDRRTSLVERIRSAADQVSSRLGFTGEYRREG
jgi:IclR family KDG regulon transcriptional repressor